MADEPVSRILRLGPKAPFERSTYGKQRTYSVNDVNCVTRARIAGTRRTHPLSILVPLALLLFAGIASAQEQPRIFRIHTVNKMILLDVLIEDKPATLLIDTGAHVTVIFQRLAKDAKERRPMGLQGVNGITRAQEARITVAIGEEKFLIYALVSEMDSMSQGLHAKIDGVLGMDVLRDYEQICIDLPAKTLTLSRPTADKRKQE